MKNRYPRSTVIVSAVRTAIGKFGGSLAGFTALDLAAKVGVEVLRRSGLDPGRVDQVILSNARQAGVGPNPGRAVIPLCGIPMTTAGYTVNMACGSGLKAVELACQAIALREADVVLVIGVEAMSQIPYLLTGARWGYRLGDGVIHDALHKDGFICGIIHQHMGLTAENIAKRYGISRKESDAYAVESQNRAESAIKEGWFGDEILPLEVPQKKGPPVIFSQDEHPRFGSTMDSVARLAPAFLPNGIVTAASASGITDGAAAVVLMAEGVARSAGLPSLLRILSIAEAGVDPEYMGLGPVPATQKALEKAELSIGDVDVVEINEAFAPQVLACEREMCYKRDISNVDGGAIALGHPIGMTGVRMLVHLAHAMPRRGDQLGLATMCVNGGMGMSAVVEAIQ